MSVIAMTMDDQRPLVNTYDKKMQDQQKYEQNVHNNANNVTMGSIEMASNAPPSGPASPTPSGSEEPMSQQYHHNISQYHQQQQQQHHHHHHHHSHHHSKTQQSPYILQQQPHNLHHHRLQQQQPQQQSPQRATDNNVLIEQKPPLPMAITSSSSSSSSNQLKKVELNQTSSLTCAVTVKAESVIDENHSQQMLEETIQSLKEERSRLLQQCADSQRREKILMRRLANKEQEFQDYVNQISEYKAAQAPSAMALRSSLLDPAVNLIFVKLSKELKITKARLEETQNELSAWKFTPDSNTGKRLMAKCRLLYQENEELGKMTSNGRLAKLESELSMQKSFSKLLIKSQSELDEFLHELDDDVEGMQSTILLLQQDLKAKNEIIQLLQKEIENLRQNNERTSNTNNNNNNTNNNNDIENKIDMQKTEALDLVTESINGEQQMVTPKIEIEEDEDVANTNMTVNYTQNIERGGGDDIDTKDLNIDNNAIVNDLSSLSSRHEANELVETATAGYVARNEATPYFNGTAAENMITGISASDDIIAQQAINSRKRSHEESNNPISDNKVQVIQQQAHLAYVATQRMLPPKKSKLRVTAEEMAEQESYAMPVAEEALSLVMEKDPLASTHNNNDMLVGAGCEDLSDDNAGIGGMGLAAQRILTRRRSMRQQTQPNGSINMTMVGNGNGNEINDAAALN